MANLKQFKNTASVVGFFAGFIIGHLIHQHAIGISFGLLFALAIREAFD